MTRAELDDYRFYVDYRTEPDGLVHWTSKVVHLDGSTEQISSGTAITMEQGGQDEYAARQEWIISRLDTTPGQGVG